MTLPRATSIPLLLTLLPLAACATASLVEVRSLPAGARIFVEGVDTNRVTPATIDLEAWAPDPDAPMRVEVRLEGYVPTVSAPYPRRHECGQIVCEHKQKHYLSCRLPLFAKGTGVRVEIHYEYAYQVAFDGGPWTAVDEPSLWPEDSAGKTFELPPGRHVMRYRTTDPKVRISRPDGVKAVDVPERGYVAFSLFWSP
jgi:hypothetical protein